jgi:putative Mn2+ efflux pump MntP
MNNLIVTSIILGVGLAMDAFSVSLANGLANTNMKAKDVLAIAGTFGLWQFLMPLAGWVLVHTAAEHFAWFEKTIPWIALILLCFIGGKMLASGFREKKCVQEGGERCEISGKLSLATLTLQGIATSIDALSVGFANASYNSADAVVSALIIGIVTCAICVAGVNIGKKVGTRLSWGASVLGGIILIAIGIKIIVS